MKNLLALYSSEGGYPLIITSNDECEYLQRKTVSVIMVDEGLCNDMTGDLVISGYSHLHALLVKKNSLKNLNSLRIDNAFALTNIVTEDGTYPNGAFYYVKNVTITSTLIYD